MSRMSSSVFLLVWMFLLTTQTDQIVASHFRGGLISWRPLNPQLDEGETVTIEISWRVSWRRSAQLCTDADIMSLTILPGEGALACTCSDFDISLSYICTGYSASEDWTTGINTATYTASENMFTVGFSGSAWLTLMNGAGSWDLLTIVDLTVRADTGRINSAPVTDILPVVPFKNGCTNTLTIPVRDVDGDDVRCFWATNCGGICGPVPGFTLDSDNCELVLPDTSTVSSGLYGIALEIRDFANEASTTALSQTPVQFLLDIKSTPETCSQIPMFIDPTPECGSCVSVTAGTTYNGQLVARSSGPTVSIASIETVSPTGLSKSNIMPYPGGQPTDYFIEVAWEPTAGVQSILCFLARDSVGNASPFCCVTLSSSDSPPEVLSNSLTPASGSTLVPGLLKMQLQFNEGISRPTLSAFISVFDETDTMVFQVDASDDTQVDFLENDVIAFVIPADGFIGSYYVTLDAAVTLLRSSCALESVAVADTSFWTFTILAPWDFHCFVTPPVRNLRSMKPVELLAVAGGGPDAFTTTFRGRDHGEFYSNGMFVSYEATLGATSTDGDTLRIYKSTLLEPEKECSKAKRFGVHFCDYFSTVQRFSAQVLIHNQEVLIPRDAIRTVVVSTGETLTLCINPNIPKAWKGPIAWSFNGRDPLWLRRWTGSTCIHVKHIQTCQAGVYEAYRRICGRKEKQHAYFDVRVRACPDGFHTPPACSSTCSVTCVLGYCGDDGQCLCRNGLTGENCDTATRGQFGLIDGDIPCATVGLDADCKGSLMCSQHAGCSCAPGWKGINCDEECESLTWGPDCVFSCNGGTSCDRFTGV
ncbi:uncharacterized protein [Apostichopus japonicus]|uniref:uncharacterized protein isoform X2 n=1 Tax=Stichopus japonicus TaxID=307972 RepID=UPI003AB38011